MRGMGEMFFPANQGDSNEYQETIADRTERELR